MKASLLIAALLSFQASTQASELRDPWPALGRESKPWAYWWWMGSAVDETNLTRELQRYQLASMGGVHIIPIYGAMGYEDKFITYLSPKWMQMLHYTVREAGRLGLGVDMTTGTGWCFGGPRVTDEQANASVVSRTFDLGAGARLSEKLDPKSLQALMAFPEIGECLDLTKQLGPDGTLDWAPPSGSWKLYAISQKPSGQKVKRASPGGQGHMLNLIYPEAMKSYLAWFEEAFSANPGPVPRAMYHDSYEYRSDWAPNFFSAFEKRRKYRLETQLPALFANFRSNALPRIPDQVARVKSDYRETISDVMLEESLPLWANWSRQHGFITRNEAHGSPGNWLDLYAAADVPETEMFHTDRNKLISKFASSAAHVSGKNLVAAETGTWLAEHFTENLADMKFLVDDLFLSGVNHVFYHGTCYSPDEAAWPGWLFYASYEMNPRNSIWRDVPALNAYVARCQAVLQSGKPDNDVLLYWPIYDVWHNPSGLARTFTVHARDWFEGQPIGKTAEALWNRGYAFDYVSDRQLGAAEASAGRVAVRGGAYQAVVVPPTEHMPVATLSRLLDLADSGATIIFEEHLPGDVPGWGRLGERRKEFETLIKSVVLLHEGGKKVRSASRGKGLILVGEVQAALSATGVAREKLFDKPGLLCVRRAVDSGWFYFVANRSEKPVAGWIPLSRPARSAVVMDPLTGRFGLGTLRTSAEAEQEIHLSLEPGESLILRCEKERQLEAAPDWPEWEAVGKPKEVGGGCEVVFLEGGPKLPAATHLAGPASWTTLNDTNAQNFAGTALYRMTFDRPGQAEHWLLDLGKLCQSARVRLNGQDLGTLITPPFRTAIHSLKPKENVLEVEVTNVAANRIRDMDRRRISWKKFYDINFVGIDYKPFDAANWPLTDSGLLGPVTLTELAPAKP